MSGSRNNRNRRNIDSNEPKRKSRRTTDLEAAGRQNCSMADMRGEGTSSSGASSSQGAYVDRPEYRGDQSQIQRENVQRRPAQEVRMEEVDDIAPSSPERHREVLRNPREEENEVSDDELEPNQDQDTASDQEANDDTTESLAEYAKFGPRKTPRLVWFDPKTPKPMRMRLSTPTAGELLSENPKFVKYMGDRKVERVTFFWKTQRILLPRIFPVDTTLHINYRCASKLPQIFVKDLEKITDYYGAEFKDRLKKLKAGSKIVQHNEESVLCKNIARVKDVLKEEKNMELKSLPSWVSLMRATRFKIASADFKNKQYKDASKKDSAVDYKLPDWLNDFDAPRYIPPGRRVMILENVTFNVRDVIPVYSDLPSDVANVSGITIPNTLVYNYGEVNRVHCPSEPLLAKILEEAEKPENIIACDCHGDKERFTPCWENPDCPCYRANVNLQELQGNSEVRCEFRTFEPILTSNANEPYFNYIGFACSEKCGCAGKCTNNAVYLAEKRVFPLEIYRADEELGFGLRSMSFIPAGTPFMEFTGQITGKDHLREDCHDYSFQISHNGDTVWRQKLESMSGVRKKFHELLVKANKKEFHIDPKAYGNAARTIAHSCLGNTQILRVYQKCFSPSHVRLILVAVDNIFPGEPVNFDYGKEYMQQQLKTSCGCKTFACHIGPHRTEVDTLNPEKIAVILEEQFSHRREDFEELQAKSENCLFRFAREREDWANLEAAAHRAIEVEAKAKEEEAKAKEEEAKTKEEQAKAKEEKKKAMEEQAKAKEEKKKAMEEQAAGNGVYEEPAAARANVGVNERKAAARANNGVMERRAGAQLNNGGIERRAEARRNVPVIERRAAAGPDIVIIEEPAKARANVGVNERRAAARRNVPVIERRAAAGPDIVIIEEPAEARANNGGIERRAAARRNVPVIERRAAAGPDIFIVEEPAEARANVGVNERRAAAQPNNGVTERRAAVNPDIEYITID